MQTHLYPERFKNDTSRECVDGNFGADCSIVPQQLKSSSVRLNATSWRYFNVSGNVQVTVSSSPGPVKVFTRVGNVPSQSFFDAFYTGTNLDFHTQKNDGGQFVAVFNPDLENPIGK